MKKMKVLYVQSVVTNLVSG